MAYLINSAGLETTGTTGDDLFVIQSGAAKGTTINGLAGVDTIRASAGLSTATSMDLDAAGGADVIFFSGGEFSASTILGGAGGDSLTFTGTIASESVVKAGDGNDTLTFGSGDYQSSQILLGDGADSIVIGNNTETVSGSDAKLGLGAGADTLTLDVNDFNSATIFGGGGADSITISGMGTESSVLINLDSTVNGGGGDTLNLSDAIGEDSTIKGKGGADFITVSGLSLSSRVEGNAGGDSITISGVVATTGQFIGGGQGNDTLVVADITESGFMTIQGGGGNDSIDLLSFSGQDNFIFGGAGADTIDFGTLHSGEIGFSAFTDSTLASMDTLTGAATVSGMTLNFSAANQTFATGVLASTQTGVSATITDGVATGGVFTSAQGVTARVAILDEASGVKGTTFFFDATEGSATVNYLFVQGGTTGETSDDLVVKLSLAQSGQVVNLETDYKIDLQT